MSDDTTLDLGDKHSSSRGSGPTFTGLSEIAGLTPANPDHDPFLGKDIGGVTIIRLIAEGGMGRVYEGKQEKPSRTVAVKVMRPGLASPSLLKRFEYEAEVLGRLQHPGIAHIYSVGVHQMGNASVPYFVMEYIANARTLTQYAEDLKLPTRQRLDLFRSVCDAVAHGHQKGVIHRDLKPSNILVDASGQPKVIDFGVARATDSDMALTTMQTDVGQLIGTLQYMSPEQFDGNPDDIDIRSDVYALGVVLYELLAGKPPYDVKKKAIYEVMRIVKEEDPTPLSSFNRALRGDVAVIAGKCLEKDRSRRYSSATEVGADIGRYLTGEPIAASPPGFIDGVVRLAKKHRAAAASLAGAFVALVLAVIGISVFAKWAQEARVDAEALRKQADSARVTAEQQRQQSQAAEAKAVQEKAIATQRLYEANLYQVHQLIQEYNLDLARSLFHEMTADYEESSLPIEMRHLRASLNQSLVICDVGTFGFNNFYSPLDGGFVFSPDGTRLATSSTKTVQLWDVVTGKQLAELKGHGGGVLSLAFSPDGTRLATGSKDKTVRLWDTATGKQLAVLEGHGDWIGRLAFSPDGARLAMGATYGKTVELWDVATARKLITLTGHEQAISAFAFSPDGTRLATGSSTDKTVRLWDVTTGEQLGTVKLYDLSFLVMGAMERIGDSVDGLTFSPDGGQLAIWAYENETVQLWDVVTGKQLAELKGHGGGVLSLAFSPDGTRLATGSKDKTVRLWDTATGKQLAVLEGHGDWIVGLAFRPDGSQLATGAKDHTSALWDIATGNLLAVFAGHSGWISGLAFSRNGTQLATVSSQDGTARLWDVAASNQLAVLQGHGAKVSGLMFSPDGARLATVADDKTVRLWDVYTSKQLKVLPMHSDWLGALGDSHNALAFSPDNARLATWSRLYSSARLWDVATGKQLKVFDKRDGESVEFSPDGTRLVTESKDGTARLWDVAIGKQLSVIPGASRPVALSPDGTRLATMSKKEKFGSTADFSLWDVATGKQLAVVQVAARPIAFSPDGTRLATSGCRDNRSVRLWDVATGKQLAILEGAGGGISNLVFSPDGARLAAGFGRNEPSRLWDTATGKQLAELEGHGNRISCLTFSPDGARLATGSYNDKTARVWDVATGKQLTALRGHRESITAIAFSPDGTRLATGAEDGTARLWGVSNAEIYDARLKNAAIERELANTVSAWLRLGPDAAVAKLKEAKATMTPDEYRVAGNLILSRRAARTPAKPSP